jgi:hypothetical protein
MIRADLPQREPITDLEYIVGYVVGNHSESEQPEADGNRPLEVQRPSRVTSCPELSDHIAEYLAARHRDCNGELRIQGETQARATLQAHRHHVGAPCLQKRAALAWLSENGLIVRSSQYDRAE